MLSLKNTKGFPKSGKGEIKKGISLTEGFPDDLSIVATLRPAQGINSVLFAVYSDAGDEQLVVSVGKTVTLIYQEGDDEGNRSPPLQVDFGVRMNDGKSVVFFFFPLFSIKF